MDKTNTSIAEQMNAQIDRSKWCKYKVSDFVKNIVEKIVPKDSDLTHYIGLEHLDSGSLHIKRFGDPSALSGDKLKIYKGDIIFAKRNAYLKRAAVAEFDAIASAHSMVLRANPEIVLPEFLPFFMMSEVFWAKAIEISVGSLSPTINWKTLAKQKFLLPPKDQQAKLAELLWAADANFQSSQLLASKLRIHNEANAKELLWRHFDSKSKTYLGERSEWKLSLLSEECKVITKGTTPTTIGFSFMDAGVNFYKIESFDLEGNLLSSAVEYVSVEAHEALSRSQLEEDDILFSIAGALGRAAIVDRDMLPGNTNQALCIIRPKQSRILSQFLIHILRSRYIQNLIGRINVKAAQANISLTNVREFRIPVPPIADQRNIVLEFSKLIRAQEEANRKTMMSKQLLHSHINEIFSQPA